MAGLNPGMGMQACLRRRGPVADAMMCSAQCQYSLMMQRRVIALTAPSGAGKTTLARRVLAAFPEMRFSVSVTTRPPRDTERHGVDYHFVSAYEFRRLIDEGALLEYEEVYPDQFYGTLRSEFEGDGAPVLLDIDVKGAARVQAEYEALIIFVAPPSLEVLKNRLSARATESDAALRARFRRVEKEMAYAGTFDAVVVNDDLERAANEAISLVRTYLNK